MLYPMQEFNSTNRISRSAVPCLDQKMHTTAYSKDPLPFSTPSSTFNENKDEEEEDEEDISILSTLHSLSPAALEEQLNSMNRSHLLHHTVPDLTCYHLGKRKRPRVPQQQEQPQVSFATKALVYSPIWTEQEVYNAWYTNEQLDGFKQERKNAVRRLKQINFDVPRLAQHECVRGYEPYYSVEMNKAVRYARDLVSSLVLCEQQRQSQLGIVDTEGLRYRSEQASEWARENALELGMNDALEEYHGHVRGHECDTFRLPSRFALVDMTMVQDLENAVRFVRGMMVPFSKQQIARNSMES